MSITIGPPAIDELRPRIAVIGVGGAGGNAIANMIGAKIQGVEFVVVNTDAQALNNSIAEHRIQLGPDITQGLGAGARPEVGRAAAEETLPEIERALDGTHMCFIAAGMGGGTGTGAAPVIAEAARRKGVLTVGVVTKPFLFEGTRRMRAAESGIEELQKHVDTLIVIPNQNLFLIAKAETTFKEAFQLADEVLQQGVRSITDLMVMPGLINLDFADVRSVMGEMGKAMMGTGEGEGENRALEAAERAIANPLLDGVSMQGAKGVIISIIGGDDMKLLEVDEAANHIRELVDPDANIIWGSAFDPALQGKIRVSVVATGIEQNADHLHQPATRPFSLAGGGRAPVFPAVASARPTAAEPAPGADHAPAEAHAGGSAPVPTADHAAPAGHAAGAWAEAPSAAGTGPHPAEAPGGSPAPDAAAAPAHQPDRGHGATPPQAAALPLMDHAAPPAPAASPAAAAPLAPLAPLNPPVAASEPVVAVHEGGGEDELLLEEESAGEEPPVAAPRFGKLSTDRPATKGSTLFERMARLSGAGRGESEDEEEAEGESGGALNIPRFLGRQNNQ